jgi:DNA-binding CsgD family transcriptional regulator
LDSICRRLQVEGSPVIIRDGTELPIMAFVKRERAADDDVQGIGFVDFQELPAPPIEALVEVFDLSPAEARLAQKLARGRSLEEASQSLEIKLSTARSQLAAIFQKTGTRRQARLVALLSRLAHILGLAADRELCRCAESSHEAACV